MSVLFRFFFWPEKLASATVLAVIVDLTFEIGAIALLEYFFFKFLTFQ